MSATAPPVARVPRVRPLGPSLPGIAPQPWERVEPRELARRLLADVRLRSVTIDADADDALLAWRDRPAEHASVAWLAARSRGAEPLDDASVLAWPEPQQSRVGYLRAPRPATGWRRGVHLGLAGLWFALAVLGAILPGLPCTCFVLLTSYSLCRSCPALDERLVRSHWFGPTLRRWRLYRGVRDGVKTKALATMGAMIGASLLLAPLPPVAWWSVAAAGGVGAACVARLRVVAC